MNEMKQILFEKAQTGINMSFLLLIPQNMDNYSTLILNGITPDVGTNEQEEIDKVTGSHLFGTYLDSYKEALRVAMRGNFESIYMKLARDYNNPMLIPIIPRCIGLNTGFLGYDVYHENYERAIQAYNEGRSRFSEEDLNKFRGLHNQIAAMIYYAVDYLNTTYNLNLDYKVIATGYSASSKMVNYFTALHPDLVKMVIAGGTGGLMIRPTKDYDYPLGFRDIGEKNLELYKQIPQFYYIGEGDQNDPSRPEFEVKRDKNGNKLIDPITRNVIPDMEDGHIKFIKDESGNYVLRDGGYYSLEQTYVLHPEFSDVQKRTRMLESIYKDSGMTKVVFEYCQGNHQINDDRLERDILQFYESNLSLKPEGIKRS